MRERIRRSPLTDTEYRWSRLRSLLKNNLGPKDSRSGCIPWLGTFQSKGYGYYSSRDRSYLVHRGVMELALGRILERHEHVLHRCDNPICCNLDHLWIGTHADNMADMAKKKRAGFSRHPENYPRGQDHWVHRTPWKSPLGERHPLHKLTEDDIPIIRNDPRSYVKIAEDYGVSDTLIRNIKLRKTWKHVA